MILFLARYNFPSVSPSTPPSLFSPLLPLPLLQVSSDMESAEPTGVTETSLSVDDLLLFADLYHAPFHYGPRGVYMLTEFKWLKVCG